MRRAVLARHSANHPCLKSEVKGLRPLHVAVMFGRAEVVAALLALKARPEETADGMFKGAMPSASQIWHSIIFTEGSRRLVESQSGPTVGKA